EGPNHIEVSLRRDLAEHQAVLEVRDQGIGLDPETLHEIFEPFHQVRSGVHRNHSGLGLGLAVVRGVVALHHGRVSATSEGRGRGSTFTVALPLTSESKTESSGPNLKGRTSRRVL